MQEKEPKIIELRLSPEDASNEAIIKQKAISRSGISPKDVHSVEVLKRSIDARQSHVKFQLRIAVHLEKPISKRTFKDFDFQDVTDKDEVHIIGAGPAGYFAALECLRKGLKPIVMDRGKDVQQRRKDLRAIQQEGVVNPDSNYCFGEGGAGTYSDGKLYTRSFKRGKIKDVLSLLVIHDANPDIEIDAHPHIGSNKLPKIISNIRATIEKMGGEVRFDSKVTDFKIVDNKLVGYTVNDTDEVSCETLILATGHSARDIFDILHKNEVYMEFKPFALGVRVEHPQSFIDSVQYKCDIDRGPYLPAASYALKAQINNQGMFSFCMCPGGLIIPAATAPGEIVVNGMSLSKRDSPYSNSGVVVEISQAFLEKMGFKGLFAGIEFQKSVEQAMFNASDGTQRVPAQRLVDFVKRRVSTDLPASSYIPGLNSQPMHDILPAEIADTLIKGFKHFNKKMKGYLHPDAVVVGTESRTSSPLKIPRDRVSYEHVEIAGLFPCGEGAGYAGGILSAAMDGQNVIRAISRLQEESV